MGFIDFILNSPEYLAVVSMPIILYALYKMKKFKPSKNDLTPLLIKLNKQKEAMNQRSKSKLF
jgi:hypothetical protein